MAGSHRPTPVHRTRPGVARRRNELPDNDPETAFLAARQHGLELFHADVPAGQQLLQDIEDALAGAFAMGRRVHEPGIDLRAEAPGIPDLVDPPRLDDVRKKILRTSVFRILPVEVAAAFFELPA